MASINASGDAAMRRMIWIGNLTSIRTVEKVAATVEVETIRGIRVSIRERAPKRGPSYPRDGVRRSAGSWFREAAY